MKADLILKNYEIAKERYAALGVDTDKAIETLEKTPISLHCWQADDVVGFERGEAASGGIQQSAIYSKYGLNCPSYASLLSSLPLLYLSYTKSFSL